MCVCVCDVRGWGRAHLRVMCVVTLAFALPFIDFLFFLLASCVGCKLSKRVAVKSPAPVCVCVCVCARVDGKEPVSPERHKRARSCSSPLPQTTSIEYFFFVSTLTFTHRHSTTEREREKRRKRLSRRKQFQARTSFERRIPFGLTPRRVSPEKRKVFTLLRQKVSRAVCPLW